MTSTIIFACKSNSCRSQMAEGWAKHWLHNERAELEARRVDITITDGDALQRDRRLLAFLDGLVLASVALDESSVASTSKEDNYLTSSPRSSLTHFFAKNSSPLNQITNSSTSCVTCDGESCLSPLRRKNVKSKAIAAMALDGVDISDATPKTIHDVLHLASCGGDEYSHCTKKQRSFALFDMLRSISLQMSLAYAGVVVVENKPESKEEESNSKKTLEEDRFVDSLVVLCSCAPSLKQKLSNMSKETFEWNIDPPTAFANDGEGDGAYLRVSRQIRVKVETFMNHLKESVMNGKLECCDKNNKYCNAEVGSVPFACKNIDMSSASVLT